MCSQDYSICVSDKVSVAITRGAHLIVGHADSRYSIRVRPEVVLDELEPIVLEVLAAVAERLPVDLPLADRVRERARKVRKVALVRLHGLLGALELEGHLLELLALHERRLRGERVDPHAVRLVLLARLLDVRLLRLLRLEVLFDHRLERLLVVCLSPAERGNGALEVRANLLRDLEVVAALLVRFEPERVERHPEITTGYMRDRKG